MSSLPSVTAANVSSDAYLLDVREQDEWDAGHAPDAHHVPMSVFPSRIDEVPADGDVVVICRHGHRSAQVAGYLIAQGRTNVTNLDGGIVEWVAAGRPLVSDDGRDPYVA